MRRCFLLLAILLASSCNFSDPLKGEPIPGTDTNNNGDGQCQSDSDCNDHGVCGDDNVCECDPGYVSDDCDDCDTGYVLTADETCEPTGGCEDGQVPSMDDAATCVDDLCADDPCTEVGQVPGTCTMISDTDFACDCEEDFSGDKCEPVAGGCASVLCENDGMCVEDGDGNTSCECADRFGGDTCGECLPPYQNPASGCTECEGGGFGPDCMLSCEAALAQPTWDMGTGWSARIPIFFQNQMDIPSPRNTVINYTFDHKALVDNNGSLDSGRDIRVLWYDPQTQTLTEIPRVLGVDSGWSRTDTTIAFRSQRQIQPGGFDLYWIYALNPDPPEAPENAAGVFRRDRGWFADPQSNPLYSHELLGQRPISLQLRQLTSGEEGEVLMGYYYYDETDGMDSIQLTVSDAGAEYFSQTFRDIGGTPGSNAVDSGTFTVPPEATNLTVTFVTNVANGRIYWGDQQQTLSGGQTSTRSYSRLSPTPGGPPTLFEDCGVDFITN